MTLKLCEHGSTPRPDQAGSNAGPTSLLATSAEPPLVATETRAAVRIRALRTLARRSATRLEKAPLVLSGRFAEGAERGISSREHWRYSEARGMTLIPE
jgi:hypothetical protein